MTVLARTSAAVLAIAVCGAALVGCGAQRYLPAAARAAARLDVEQAAPALKAAAEGLREESWLAVKAKAAADLASAGAGFACFFPVDDAADDLDRSVKAELYRRAQLADLLGLDEIAAEYAYALQPDEDLSLAQTTVFGLYVLSTYCNVDQALG
jgi:type IV secretory pathway TrbL component